MDAFTMRIGLGCGRLGGGAAEANSRRLLSAALKCGIRYFDTAPSYGGGASERILGSVLNELRSEIQLCTKVGLPRGTPSAVAALRTLILGKVRLAMPETMVTRLNQLRRVRVESLGTPRGFGNFELNFVRQSLQQSLQALQTDRLDCLMLHEPRMSDPDVDLAQALQGWVEDGTVLRLGVATGAEFEHLPRFGSVAQFKVGAAEFDGAEARELIGHGLLRGLSSANVAGCIDECGILQRMPSLRTHLAQPLGAGAFLLAAVLIGTRIQRLLISTASPARLIKFMGAARNIFDAIQCLGEDRFSWEFKNFIQLYFGRRIDPGGAAT